MKNILTINEILFWTIILYIYFEFKHNTIENFDGDINIETCLQRILEDGGLTGGWGTISQMVVGILVI